MRVKVTPPYEGAGSWEDEIRSSADVTIAGACSRAHMLESGAQVPASWCEPIPEITPEPGDIVEDYQGTIFVFDPSRSATPFKVSKILARKPKGGLDAHDAIHEFFRDLSDAETASADVAAYNKFLSAILGVPYGRVEG